MTEWFADNNSLPALETDCWNLLTHAVSDRDCGWRLPVLATSAVNGVQQRTLVLRSVNRRQRELLFHTDVRSPKHAQLVSDPRVSLLFYDSVLSSQLIICGIAALHHSDEVANAVWNSSPPETLRQYLAPVAPGTVVETADCNLPQYVRGRIPDRSEVEPGRDHFAVIRVRALSLDWLHLSREGNRRARFEYPGDHEPHSLWTAP